MNFNKKARVLDVGEKFVLCMCFSLKTATEKQLV